MNKYQLMLSLKPHEALRLLNAGASSVGGKGIEQIRLKLMIEPDLPARVMLVAPNPAGDLAKAMFAAYKELFPGGSGLRMVDKPPPDTVDFQNGVATIVTLPRQDEEPAPLATSDYLVFSAGGPERAGRILGLIASNATQVASAAWAGEPGQGLLFHVIADAERDESFTSLVRDQLGGTVLRAFEAGRSRSSEPWLVFAPEQRAPGRQTLASFSALAQLAGAQFSRSGQPEGSTLRNRRLLAALLPRALATNGATPVDLLYLRHLEFLGQARVAPPVRPPSEARFLTLSNSPEALKQLRQAIDRAGKAQGVRVGYHLRLRSTRYVAEPHRDRDRLLEQKELIEQKLEYLDSTELPRPKLLRFSDAQLPALADYVRSYPMRVLADEQAIRYAFQSTESDGTGVHFLLVDPARSPRIEVDPLPRWENVGDPTIRFWLDPFWARTYLGEGESLIYVPEGFYMTPTMHAPSKRELDDYLRTVMEQWCRPEYGVPPIPRRPIYLFEPHPTQADHLVIAVLDQEQFLPLGRQLDWLNRHLHVRHARLRGREILDRTSDVLSDDDLIKRLDGERAVREQRLQAAAAQAAAQAAQSTDYLTRLLTEDLQAVLKLSQETLQALREAKERLSQLYIAQAQAQALEQEATRSVAQTQAVAAAAGKETSALNREVQAQAAGAAAAHEDARLRIEQLEQLYKRLRDELDRR